MNCKICDHIAQSLFETKVLNKYEVEYFQCENCKFIQTEAPYWLEEAYGSAITKLDIGLIQRNLLYADQLEDILLSNDFNADAKFLDYGGGYGMFVRLMRDKGFDYYRQDYYCENLFAEYFDINDLKDKSNFELLTAFEVFEHIPNPQEELDKMLKLSDSILFSTVLQPNSILKNPNDWWYFIPETGQHISLYSLDSLKFLANKNNLNLYTNGEALHLFTKKELQDDPFKQIPVIVKKEKKLIERFLSPKKEIVKNVKVKRESLISKDFDYIKNMLR